MAAFTFTTAVGAVLAGAAIALAGPALAYADATDTTTSTSQSGAGSSDTDSTSTTSTDRSSQERSRFSALRDAIRSGEINSTRPVAGLDDPSGDPLPAPVVPDLPAEFGW